MKLWRKLAMAEGKSADGRRPGRSIKYGIMMRDQAFKGAIKTYPLLSALMNNAGITPRMTPVSEDVPNAAV